MLSLAIAGWLMVGLFEAEDLAAGPVHFKSRERKKKI